MTNSDRARGFRLTDPTERQVDSREARIAVADWGGQGRDVVLLHGAMGNVAYFDSLVAHLGDAFRLVGYDLRGHGQSGIGPGSVDLHVGDLSAVIDGLGLIAPVLVGVSYGALIALRAAARSGHPFAGLVNIDGPLIDRADASNWTERGGDRDALVAHIRESISSRPHPWTGSAEQLINRLEGALAEGKGYEARNYVALDANTFTQRPDVDVLAEMVVSARAPFEADWEQLRCPAVVLAATGSEIDGSADQRRELVRSFGSRHPSIDMRPVIGGHDLVGEDPTGIAELLREWMSLLAN